jgi:hypothetical protein
VVFISITCAVAVLMYGLVLLRTRQDASIMTSAFVFTYSLYLQWSALSSDTDITCNPYKFSEANTYTILVLGLIFTFTVLFVISASTKQADNESVAMAANAALLDDEQDSGEKVADIEEGG